ncbi:MAG TPA: hypothetical protein VE958_06980 [Bryobacteraceae bacterium]|nr:hypothetical protein [Bryobacteraceae bacterium]
MEPKTRDELLDDLHDLISQMEDGQLAKLIELATPLVASSQE